MSPRRMQPRTPRPSFEALEGRTLMSAGHPVPAAPTSFVYVESNNPNAGQNAVLAYRADPTTGALTPVPGGRYLTGGTGQRNAAEALGPDDSDKEVIASPDGRFLFAVNQGSNTVSTFDVEPDGSLSLVEASPAPSGGVEPDSLSLSGDHLYVSNRGDGAEGTPATVAPTVASFIVGADGTLFAVPSATVTLPKGLSPAQVLTSADGRFTFVDNFATPSDLKVSLANTIEPFVDGADGSLSAVKNGAAGLSTNPPLVLGLVEDPVHHLIYAGRAPAGGGVHVQLQRRDRAGEVRRGRQQPGHRHLLAEHQPRRQAPVRHRLGVGRRQRLLAGHADGPEAGPGVLPGRPGVRRRVGRHGQVGG